MSRVSLLDHYRQALHRDLPTLIAPDGPRAHDLDEYSVVRLPPDNARREWFHGTDGMTARGAREPLAALTRLRGLP